MECGTFHFALTYNNQLQIVRNQKLLVVVFVRWISAPSTHVMASQLQPPSELALRSLLAVSILSSEAKGLLDHGDWALYPGSYFSVLILRHSPGKRCGRICIATSCAVPDLWICDCNLHNCQFDTCHTNYVLFKNIFLFLHGKAKLKYMGQSFPLVS